MDRNGPDAEGMDGRSGSAGGAGRLGIRIDAAPAVDAAATRWARFVAACGGPLARKGVIAALAIMMIAFSVAPLLNVARGVPYNKDYDLWQITGNIARDGKDIYPKTPGLPYPFMYPPACATMLATLSSLPRGAFVTALLLLNSAAWTTCIVASVYLATGRLRGNHPALYLWPSVAVIPFVHDTYLLGQPALLLLALLLGAFALLRRGRPIEAGALIAISTAIKAYPVLAAGYLVYRRKWRALASMTAMLAALMFVAPLAFRTPGQVGEDFAYWVRGMLLKYDEHSIAQRPDRAYSFKNQSVQATVHRLARPVLADGEADRQWRVNLLNLDFRATTALMLAAVGGLVLFYLWSTWRAGAEPPPADAIEAAMVSLLVLVLAPLSFNYSYVWLLFPLTLLLHLAAAAPRGSSMRRWGIATVAASVVLMSLALPWRREAQAYGNVFFSGLVLLLGLGLVLRRGWYKQADAGGVPRQPTPSTPRQASTTVAQ
jgi:hypothetical protein